MSSKEEENKKVPRQITLGLKRHEWIDKLHKISCQLDKDLPELIHEALDLIMPKYLNILENRLVEKKMIDEITDVNVVKVPVPKGFPDPEALFKFINNSEKLAKENNRKRGDNKKNKPSNDNKQL